MENADRYPEQIERCIFWGKYVAEGPRCLPLAAHCLDVGLTFRGLCEVSSIRRTLSCAGGADIATRQLDRLAVLAMLHDAGKANLGFQKKVFHTNATQAGHIRELAPLLDPEIRDEELSQAFLRSLPPGIESWFSDDLSAYSYLMAAFSHHGRPLCFKGEQSGSYWLARRLWWRSQGHLDPMHAIRQIGQWARDAFPAAFEPGVPPLPAEHRFHHRFAGLVMLADWMGSHSGWFPVQSVDLAVRLRHDRAVIPAMLEAVGFAVEPLRDILAGGPGDFTARFRFPPYPLQAAIDELDPNDNANALLIAEAETGSGKTEAALNWFFKLFTAGSVDSLYFALPTRVAARELYERVRNYIRSWFPDPENRPVALLAVPGYAQIDGIPARRVLPREEDANRWQDDEDLRRRERGWSAERPKRFLAATIAVGTIDQALLSAVQTAHAHLRSVCLDRSLLVVDEVHASDYYMSRLLEALLGHHLGVGGRAMLLSATLGARARHRYLANNAHAGASMPDLLTSQNAPYPSITPIAGKVIGVGPSRSEPRRVRFRLEPMAFKPACIADRVLEALEAGARVLVILNTVARANELLRDVEALADLDPSSLFSFKGVICPHHGRFAPADRAALDQEVSRRLGPDSEAGPLLLVGTQTLEQSLDIDADLMVSDLAPADVLLQRVGRLHRHKDRTRPAGYEAARCLVLVPAGSLDSALDKRGYVASKYKRLGYGSVYEDLRTLELSRRALNERPEVRIPQDCRRLVEAVTHPQALSSLQGGRWARHGENIEGGELAQAIAASHVAAIYDQYFGEFEFNELGGMVTVRLGADSLQLPLDRPFISPFGQRLDEVVVPGHLAPKHPQDVVAVEVLQDNGTARLRCGDRRYRYGRYGLEEEES